MNKETRQILELCKQFAEAAKDNAKELLDDHLAKNVNFTHTKKNTFLANAYRFEMEQAEVVIKDIDAALAQPEQVPVFYVNTLNENTKPTVITFEEKHEGAAEAYKCNIALFATPPQPAPLTEERIFAIGKQIGTECLHEGKANIEINYARAIEAAHGIGVPK